MELTSAGGCCVRCPAVLILQAIVKVQKSVSPSHSPLEDTL